MAAFAGVAVLGVLWGVGVAIALSLLNFVRRAWRPHDAVLGRVDGLKGYHDTERHPEARLIPGLVLYRFDAPMFFANAEYFRQRILALAGAGETRWIIVAAEPITDIDATAGETLARWTRSSAPPGSSSRSPSSRAGPRPPAPLRHPRAIGHDRFFPTLGVAVAAYIQATGVDWRDWEDRAEPAP